MGNITRIEDCIVTYEGERRCVYCGATLADGEVCNCARFVNTCEKLAKADQCAEKVELWSTKRQQYLDAIYPPRYEFRMTLVRVEETSNDDEGNGGSTSDGSGDEGGVSDDGGGSGNLGEEQGGEE